MVAQVWAAVQVAVSEAATPGRLRASPSGGGGGGDSPVAPATPSQATPSQAEWEQRMGDLLPEKTAEQLAADLVADLAAADLDGPATPPRTPAPASARSPASDRAGELRYNDFCRAALAVPLLVEAMIAESKGQALKAVCGEKSYLMDSVIAEDEEERRKTGSFHSPSPSNRR